MEAYDQHLNKLKVPDIPPVEPHPDSQMAGISALHKEGVPTDATIIEDNTRVVHPSDGEYFEERVQTIKHHQEPNTPDLTKEEAIISSESSASSEDEMDHSGEQKKKSKVKKVKSKLASGLRKIFGKDKKEHHDEHHHDHVTHHEEHHDHVTHRIDGHGHLTTHHVTEDAHSSKNVFPDSIRVERDMSPLSGQSSSSYGGATSDRIIQQKLGTAFATEGIKATRDESVSESRNRFEHVGPATGPHGHLDLGRLADIQDHSKRVVDFTENSNTGIFGCEKYMSPAHVSKAEIPVFHGKGMEEFSQLRRASLDRTAGRRPSQELTSHFESLNVRPEAGHLTRSSEEWNLSPSGKEEPRLILEDVKKHGMEFSEKFQKIGGHRNSLTDNETVAEVSAPHHLPISPQPTIPIVEKILDPNYATRLSIAREKWSLPAEERAKKLVEETAALVTPAPPSGQVDHFIRQKRGLASEGGAIHEMSIATLSELNQETVTKQPFERVTSEIGLSRSDSAAANEKVSLSGSYSPQKIDSLSDQSVSNNSPLNGGIPFTGGRVDDGQQVNKASGQQVKQISISSVVSSSPIVEKLEKSEANFSDVSLVSPKNSSVDLIPEFQKNTENSQVENEKIRSLQTETKSDSKIFEEKEVSTTVVESVPEQKGVLTTVVESVAGVVGSVVGLLQAKAAEANAVEDEYLPFEVKEKTTDSHPQVGAGGATIDSTTGDSSKGLVDTVIDNVLTLLTGKTETQAEHLEEVKVESKEPVLIIPISGEFISPA